MDRFQSVESLYDISSIETIIHAAAPCPVQVKRDMIEWFGPKIIEYYGCLLYTSPSPRD